MKLACWSCGKEMEVSDQHIQFGFELAQIAEANGMRSVFDWHRRRVLIFCDRVCMANQMTRRGTIRKFAKRVA